MQSRDSQGLLLGSYLFLPRKDCSVSSEVNPSSPTLKTALVFNDLHSKEVAFTLEVQNFHTMEAQKFEKDLHPFRNFPSDLPTNDLNGCLKQPSHHFTTGTVTP